MQPSDHEILRRVQRGERNAFITLFDRYYARVESYARWQMRQPEIASDIASETFLRAYRSVDGFRTETGTPYFAYLLQICRRLIQTERGRRMIESSCSLDALDADSTRLLETEELPLASLLLGERRTMVQAALDQLSYDDREIILLAFEKDLSRRDIAEILGKPSVTAVTSHLHRAMQKLKTLLVQQGYWIAPCEQGRK